MSLEKKSYVERVLIVLNEDGSVKGATLQDLENIVDDGKIVQSKQSNPRNVTVPEIVGILPEGTAQVLEQITAMNAMIQDQANQMEQMKRENENLTRQVEDLRQGRQ